MRFERLLILGAFTLGAPVFFGPRGVQASNEGSPAPAARLQHAAPSIDRLIDDFVQAINDRDKVRLRQLRVSQEEYLGVILPGSVEPGERRPQYNQEEAEYLWGMLNGKSVYVEANLIASFGGHHATVTEKEFRKGTKKYADYTAYKQLILTLKDDKGTEATMKIGSIAEVDGQFKFISYVRD
jgi:hypothetical protein